MQTIVLRMIKFLMESRFESNFDNNPMIKPVIMPNIVEGSEAKKKTINIFIIKRLAIKFPVSFLIDNSSNMPIRL